MKRSGFTLLEVMVAIAILALSLSAIYSSQAGAIRAAHRSRKMGIATLLARCKMQEVEQQLEEEGLPAIFASGSDECCEEAEVDGFDCDWEVKPVVLPDGMFNPGEEGLDGPDSEGGGDEPKPDPLSEVDPEDVLSGGGSADGVAMMAMSFAYPALKPSFESQIRRATVTVNWKEGSVARSLDVTQFIVSSDPVQLTPDEAPSAADEASP
ncbi:MAG: type II secretion system GspH family protein [Myxococcales bacterium]|nr:type II secretion system GspH family protein [Myxococcales bacterium]